MRRKLLSWNLTKRYFVNEKSITRFANALWCINAERVIILEQLGNRDVGQLVCDIIPSLCDYRQNEQDCYDGDANTNNADENAECFRLKNGIIFQLVLILNNRN